MSFEVTQVLVVVSGEIADCIIYLCRGIEDGLGVMGEPSKVGAVFLRKQCLDVFAFFGVIELEGVIATGSNEVFARIVEVKGRNMGFGFGEFIKLSS